MKKSKHNSPTVICSSDMKTVKGKVAYWSIFAFLVLASLAAIVPVLWIVLTAFKDTQEIYQSFSFFPKNVTLDNALEKMSLAWEALDLGRSVLNTILFSLGSLAITLSVCGFGGYALSKLKPRGSKLVLMLLVWTMMMPGQIRTVSQYISFMHFPFASEGGINMLNTYWPMWIAAGSDVFSTLLFKNSFDAVPTSCIEAARIDGASDARILFTIAIPLSLSVVIFVTIGSLSGAWSNFFLPYLVLGDEEKLIVPVKVFMLAKDTTIKMNTYMMALVFAAVPPFIIFVFFQKYIVGGINVGGVKG